LILSVVLGVSVLLVALVFLGGSVQPCLSFGACIDTRAAWLDSLSPFDRFRVEHADTMKWIAFGLPIAAIVLAETTWRAARHWRTPRGN
jgi:hypothetical protein